MRLSYCKAITLVEDLNLVLEYAGLFYTCQELVQLWWRILCYVWTVYFSEESELCLLFKLLIIQISWWWDSPTLGLNRELCFKWQKLYTRQDKSVVWFPKVCSKYQNWYPFHCVLSTFSFRLLKIPVTVQQLSPVCILPLITVFYQSCENLPFSY